MNRASRQGLGTLVQDGHPLLCMAPGDTTPSNWRRNVIPLLPCALCWMSSPVSKESSALHCNLKYRCMYLGNPVSRLSHFSPFWQRLLTWVTKICHTNANSLVQRTYMLHVTNLQPWPTLLHLLQSKGFGFARDCPSPSSHFSHCLQKTISIM